MKILLTLIASFGLLFLAGCHDGNGGDNGGCGLFSCMHHTPTGVKGYAAGKNTPTGPVTSHHHWNR